MGTIAAVLSAPEGQVELMPEASGRTRITLRPHDPSLYIPKRTCVTSRPEEVSLFLEFASPFAWLCDAISRHEDPDEVHNVLKRQLLAYVEPQAFAGTTLLDFGCGTGASTFFLASFLPDTEIIGVELEPARVELGRRIAAARGTRNVRFFVSPSGDSLPPELHRVDFIMFSAVYEHLLPHERRAIMPRLWNRLNPGGVLFINQTPHRWVPYEHHSTGLWGINYLSDRLAHRYARHFSKRNPDINRSTDWNTHLRGGLRGGTERGIIADATAGSHTRGVILQPIGAGLRDRADYWLAATSPRLRLVKRGIASFFRVCDRLFDTVPALNVDVAIRKELLDDAPAMTAPRRHRTPPDRSR
jgi:SAM-dependent methyltransferase